nr:putative F-box/LRR-repeat protein At3g28410 [Lolium perenne]
MSADEARQMFQGMLISPPPVSGADRISTLPDNVLQDILSLLTAQEAVRTCVLARSWRHLWRSITSLRILSPDTAWYDILSDDPEPARDLWKFVDNLLNLRDKRTELHTLDIKFGQFSQEDLPYVSLWIRSAVMCKFIFARDLEHRPIFSNVKTLLLNEYWCEAPGCGRLARVLKNSPVLEKLTLELFSEGPDHKIEMKGSYRTMEGPPAISEHLKIVEVKCNAVDERILEVLKFLHGRHGRPGRLCAGRARPAPNPNHAPSPEPEPARRLPPARRRLRLPSSPPAVACASRAAARRRLLTAMPLRLTPTPAALLGSSSNSRRCRLHLSRAPLHLAPPPAAALLLLTPPPAVPWPASSSRPRPPSSLAGLLLAPPPTKERNSN